MLKHTMFSNFYLNKKNSQLRKADNAPGAETIHGTLAVSRKDSQANGIPVSRMRSRTWWESGWK
jgi:hypothetical protein